MKIVTLLGLLALLSIAGGPIGPSVLAQERPATACDDPDGHPWIGETVERVGAENELFTFAASVAGDPVSCEGKVTVWQGEEYRDLSISFEGGLEFRVETMPPGIRIMELSAPDGFEDPDAGLRALRQLTERMGVTIDWSTAEQSEQDGVAIEQFWDPEPGLNASASVGRSAGAIVLLRWSIAP